MSTAIEFNILAKDFSKKVINDTNAALEELKKRGVDAGKHISAANREIENSLRKNAMPSFVAFNGIIADSGQLSMGVGQWLRAVTNNVQQMAQQMAYAKEKGEGFKSVIKGMALNLTGVGGMVFAVNAVTFALQMLSGVGTKSTESVKKSMDDLTISIADLDLELKNITRTKYLNILTDQIAELTKQQYKIKGSTIDWIATLGTLQGVLPRFIPEVIGTPEDLKKADESLKQMQAKFQRAVDKFIAEDEREKEKKKRTAEKHKKDIEKIASDQEEVLFQITQKGTDNRLAIELAQLDKWSNEMKRKAHGNAELVKQINEAVAKESSKLISEQKVREIKQEVELIILKHEEKKITSQIAVVELEKLKSLAEQTKNVELLTSLQRTINSLKKEEAKEDENKIKRQKELEELRFQIVSKGAEDRLQKELEILNEWERKSLKTAKDEEELKTQIRNVASKERFKIELKNAQDTMREVLKYTGQGISVISQFYSQQSEQQIQNLEQEKEIALANIDQKLQAENLSEEQKKALQEERREIELSYERDIKDEKIKAFEAERDAKLIMSIINTAEQVASVIANPFLAVVVGALGAAQTALIASQPTPSFHGGGGAMFNAPSNEETFVKIRGGEEVRVFTPEQQNQRHSTTDKNVIINNMVLQFNAPVRSEDFVIEALKEAVRTTGLTVDQLTSINKNKISFIQ